MGVVTIEARGTPATGESTMTTGMEMTVARLNMVRGTEKSSDTSPMTTLAMLFRRLVAAPMSTPPRTMIQP